MKKRFLLLSLLLITAGGAIAQKKPAPANKPAAAATQKAGGNVLSCTVDGKAYTATGSKVRAYATLKAGETPPYQLIHIFSDPQAPVNYALRFYLTPGATLAPGTYTASERWGDDARFPNVGFDLTEMKSGDGRAFESLTDGSGTVTVTSVAGGMIEGTFAFNLEGMSGKRAITNGAFRFKMPPVEKE